MAVDVTDYMLLDKIRTDARFQAAVRAAILNEKSSVFKKKDADFSSVSVMTRHRALARAIQFNPEHWVNLFCYTLAYDVNLLNSMSVTTTDDNITSMTLSVVTVLNYVRIVWDELSYL